MQKTKEAGGQPCGEHHPARPPEPRQIEGPRKVAPLPRQQHLLQGLPGVLQRGQVDQAHVRQPQRLQEHERERRGHHPEVVPPRSEGDRRPEANPADGGLRRLRAVPSRRAGLHFRRPLRRKQRGRQHHLPLPCDPDRPRRPAAP